MADKTVTSAPQPTTSPPAPQTPHQHTSHTTSDSETDYNPTPLHSPGGPQYEDLPPSYDFALSDARNGVASLDASQIEAHRVSANEGPDEPEVWEYRMRGENVDEEEETDVREEAPAYEGHVPVQHVARSENVVVGRVQGANAQHDDPPHSVPEVGGSEGPRGVPWSPFGAPGNGPFGAPGRGPFGAPGHGPFGAPGNGPFGRGQRGRHGPRRSGRGARSSSQAQDWAALGQNMGRWGEEFGRRMGNWGEQFGRQAGAMGEQIGRQAEAMGQQIGREAGARAAALSGSASTAHTTSATASSSAQTAEPPRYDDPPSYQPPTGAAGQETGVLYGDRKTDSYPTEKMPQSPSEKPSAQTLGKGKAADYDNDDDDDDNSSISSDSTDSSSSDSEEDDDYGDAQAAFLKRMESIQRTAEDSAKKGKKSLEEINHERDLAIAQAVNEKEAAELKHAKWQARRAQKKELRGRKRELKREYRQRKRESREKADGKGKGKGKAKKGSEFKDLKKEYKAKRRALKRERTDAKREWKKTKRETRKERKPGSVGGRPEQRVLNEKASGL